MRARKVLTRFYLLEDKTHKKLGNVPRRDDDSKQKTLLTQKRSPGLKKSAPACSPKRKKCKNENISLSRVCSFCACLAWWARKESPTRSEIRSPFGKKNARALVSLQEKGAAFTKTEETAAEAAAGKAFIHPRRSPDRPLLNKRKKKRRQRERDRRIPVIREKSIKSSALGKG